MSENRDVVVETLSHLLEQWTRDWSKLHSDSRIPLGRLVFRPAEGGAVPARHQNHGFIRRIDPHLMCVDPCLEPVWRFNLSTDSAVILNLVNRHSARIVVSDQQMRSGNVRADVDWTSHQKDWISVRMEGA